MKRIDTAHRAQDLFGPGRDGFKDGSPLTGDPATSLTAGMFNHLQEEIARAIEACGIALDPTQYDQLATALGLTARSLTATGYTLLPGGLLWNWGPVSATPSGGTVAGFHYAGMSMTFMRVFSATPFAVSVTADTSTIGTEFGGYANPSPTGFTAILYNSVSTLTTGTWHALGKA